MRDETQSRIIKSVARWLTGLIVLAVFSGGLVLGQERWKTYVKGPGATYVVGCLYQVSPLVVNVESSGGTVYVDVVEQGGCPWRASSPVGWVQVSNNADSRAKLVVSPVGSGDGRWTDVTVAGYPVRVLQNGAGAATIALSPLPLELSGKSGYALKGIHAVATTSQTRSAFSTDAWLTVLSGCSFTTEAWVLLEAEVNKTGTPRVGSIQIGGVWVTITQLPLS